MKLFGVVCHSKNVRISSFIKAMQYLPLEHIDVFQSEEKAREYIVAQNNDATLYEIEADEDTKYYSNTSSGNHSIDCSKINDITVAIHFIHHGDSRIIEHLFKPSFGGSQSGCPSLDNFERKKELISAYHCLQSVSNYHKCRDAHNTLLDHIQCILQNAKEVEESARTINDNENYKYGFQVDHRLLCNALKLVADVLGLDKTGKPTGHPRITVAEYKREIKRLNLASTKTDILINLSYSLLAIALVLSPALFLTGALSGGVALGLTVASGLASCGIFSKAFYSDAGYRCNVMMQRMIDSKAQTVEAELIEDFGVEMEQASSIRSCLSNL